MIHLQYIESTSLSTWPDGLKMLPMMMIIDHLLTAILCQYKWLHYCCGNKSTNEIFLNSLIGKLISFAINLNFFVYHVKGSHRLSSFSQMSYLHICMINIVDKNFTFTTNTTDGILANTSSNRDYYLYAENIPVPVKLATLHGQDTTVEC